MKKVKVAFFADILVENFDGASRTMFQLIQRIPDTEFEFEFFCGTKPKNDFNYPVHKVYSFPVPFNSTYRIALPYPSSIFLKQKLNDFKPDIIHIATPSMLGYFALNYAKQHKISTISIYHTHFISYVEYYIKNLKKISDFVKNILSANLSKFYNSCDIVYVPTMIIKSELLLSGIRNENLKIWPRGINKAIFNPVFKNKKYITALTGNNQPNILFASRLVWEKNLNTLIKIYRLSKQYGKSYNFIIAGDGVAKTELQKAMPDAIFTGTLDHKQLSILYASSDVFVFPSVTETYGNVVVEAMASGLPCIIADGGGSKDLIKNGINGFLCHPNKAEEFLTKIEIILTEPALRKKFVQSGLAYTENLSWQNLSNIYFEELRKLTNNYDIQTTFKKKQLAIANNTLQ